MGVKVSKRDNAEFNITEVDIIHEEEPSIYSLNYLVYRLDLQKAYKLSDLETKVISFILSYKNVSNKFYFGNESLGKLFDKHPVTISKAITGLVEKGLITTESSIMAGGGEIRFIRLSENTYLGLAKTLSKAKSKHLENNNKINNNKINKYMSDFNSFWEQYPKKVGKKKAESAYKRAVSSKKKEQEVMDGLSRYKEKWVVEKTDVKYIPNPLTWLNQERWEDDIQISNEQFNKNARKVEDQWERTKRETEQRYKSLQTTDSFASIKDIIYQEGIPT